MKREQAVNLKLAKAAIYTKLVYATCLRNIDKRRDAEY